MIFGLFKKKKVSIGPKPSRVAVHLKDGRVVVHYAVYRTVRADGRLSLHDGRDGSYVVADYAAGVWTSLTFRKRSVQ